MLSIMLLTRPDLSEFVENGNDMVSNGIPVTGALPLLWTLLSQSFREVVISTPSLHTSVLVVLGPERRVMNAAVVQRQLAYAGQSGLRLTIAELGGAWWGSALWDAGRDCPKRVDGSNTPIQPQLALPTLLLVTRQQLQSFAFPVTDNVVDSLVDVDMAFDDYQQLKEVKIWQPRFWCAVPTTLCSAGLWRTGITSVQYRGCRETGKPGFAFSDVVRWETLTSVILEEAVLDVYSCWSTSLPGSTRRVLEQASNLKKLEATVYDFREHEEYDWGMRDVQGFFAPLSHPNLESLHLQYAYAHDANDRGNFFTDLSFPNLSQCHIHHPLDDNTKPHPELVAFLHRHSAIVTLHLTGILYPHDTLMGILAALPSVEDLTIGRLALAWPPTKARIGPVWDDPHLCDETHVCDILLQRIASPFLRRLVLHGPFVTPSGLEDFVRHRATVRLVEVWAWEAVDCYELGSFKIALEEKYNVELVATTCVRTSIRLPVSTVQRIRAAGGDLYRGLARLFKRCLLTRKVASTTDGWGVPGDPLSPGSSSGWGGPDDP